MSDDDTPNPSWSRGYEAGRRQGRVEMGMSAVQLAREIDPALAERILALFVAPPPWAKPSNREEKE